MKEYPILFSTPMVKAILEGRKTQTRRIVKEPYNSYPVVSKHLSSMEFDFHYDQGIGQFTKCPYGKPGDFLWVRETYTKTMVRDEEGWFYIYKPDEDDWAAPWKPSIFMPKAAARIWLKITNVKVERLQDISENDVQNEGIKFHFHEGINHYFYYPPKKGHTYAGPCQLDGSYISTDGAFCSDKPWLHSFQSLWKSINGQESWDKNPWVWVISFEVISKSGKL